MVRESSAVLERFFRVRKLEVLSANLEDPSSYSRGENNVIAPEHSRSFCQNDPTVMVVIISTNRSPFPRVTCGAKAIPVGTI